MQSTTQLEMAYDKQHLEYYSYLRLLIEQSEISYWIGNPSVEIINGNIGLLDFSEEPNKDLVDYDKHQDYVAMLQKYCQSVKQRPRKKQLLLSGIPNNKSPIQVCETLKPYFKWIKQLRVVKVVDIKYYAILILMTSEKTSQVMFNQLFGVQYNSLEVHRVIFREISYISLCFSELSKEEGITNQNKLLREINQEGQKIQPKFIFMSTHKRFKKQDSPKKQQNDTLISSSPRKHSKDSNEPKQPLLMCAICLEGLNNQLISILCGHYFDWECLEKWEENTCPLCRFHQQPPIIKFCQSCNQCQGLWVCLICGIRLCCGISNNILGEDSHIYKHYQQTKHSLSMELETKFLFDARVPAFLHQTFYKQIKKNMLESSNTQTMIDKQAKNMIGMQDGKKNKVRLQVEQYERNVAEQMEGQRRFYQQSLNKTIKRHRQEISQRKAMVDKLKQQIDQLQKQQACLDSERQQKGEQLSNLQKQYQIILSYQKMLEKRMQQKKIVKTKQKVKKQKYIDELNSNIISLKEEIRDYRKNINIKQKMKQKLKGQQIDTEIMLGNEKKSNKLKKK